MGLATHTRPSVSNRLLGGVPAAHTTVLVRQRHTGACRGGAATRNAAAGPRTWTSAWTGPQRRARQRGPAARGGPERVVRCVARPYRKRPREPRRRPMRATPGSRDRGRTRGPAPHHPPHHHKILSTKPPNDSGFQRRPARSRAAAPSSHQHGGAAATPEEEPARPPAANPC